MSLNTLDNLKVKLLLTKVAMKLEITKICADSLRAFTQNNYGIKLKPTHAHELVAAYFGYSSRAALLADQQCPVSNLSSADVLVLNPSIPLIDQRLKDLADLPPGLPPGHILAEGIYAPIVNDELFSGKIWPGLHEAARSLVEERAAEFRMFGNNIGEMDWISDIDIRTTDTGAAISVVFDYPTNSAKAQRYSKVEITLPRIAGIIGFAKQEVKPIFYYGHTTDPDYRLKFGID